MALLRLSSLSLLLLVGCRATDVRAPLARAPQPTGDAPGGPGQVPTWTSGNKEAVGTATSGRSKVWFTLHAGILSEVYYPRVDTAAVRSLELAVSDGQHAWLESDLQRSLQRLDEGALLYRQVSRHPQGLFTLAKTYVTDPGRDTLLIEVRLEAQLADRYSIYAIYDPALGNTGGGDTGTAQGDALLADEGNFALHRGASEGREQGEMASALAASPPLVDLSSGFAGVNDGATDLRRHGRMTWRYARASRGNVVQTARLPRAPAVTLALGFGAAPDLALSNARASLRRGFAAARDEYVGGWRGYLRQLRPVPERHRAMVHLAAMVLRAHEDKTYPGAMIASLSIPWGQGVNADRPDIGGYHLVWARDLYHVATALLSLGDRAAAERALDYLLRVQQRQDGRFPQNSWLDGRAHWTSLQLDEVAFPIVLAWQLGRTDARTWQGVRRAADFIVAHGPRTPQERWEEEEGYSPSTIAAEIAGLVCAAELAHANKAPELADRYRRTADSWAANLEKWLVTTTGKLDAGQRERGYYLRINDDTDPDDGFQLALNNGGGAWDEREIVDAGFLELVRLGIRPASDPAIVRSLAVIDRTIRVQTPRGPAWYRYNHDGYGEKADGSGYDGTGIGRLWPLLGGERGEYEVAAGRDATPYLEALIRFAGPGGMIPEQVWDRREGTRRGFSFGGATDGATPLAWSMAQLIRLALCVQERRVVEQPRVVAERYLRR
jgi:glucoamylase